MDCILDGERLVRWPCAWLLDCTEVSGSHVGNPKNCKNDVVPEHSSQLCGGL